LRVGHARPPPRGLADSPRRGSLSGALPAQGQRAMTDADFLATAASALRWLWDAVSAALGVGVVLYATVPPIRRFVDARIAHYFRAKRFPGTVRTAVLEAWDTDRKWAIGQLRTTTRHGQVEDAERAFARAWNYFLGNELYLPDPIAQKVHQAFQPLEKTLNLA